MKDILDDVSLLDNHVDLLGVLSRFALSDLYSFFSKRPVYCRGLIDIHGDSRRSPRNCFSLEMYINDGFIIIKRCTYSTRS